MGLEAGLRTLLCLGTIAALNSKGHLTLNQSLFGAPIMIVSCWLLGRKGTGGTARSLAALVDRSDENQGQASKQEQQQYQHQ